MNLATPMSQAALDVLAERRRQISAEGWTSEHDDQHEPGMLSAAAASYALYASSSLASELVNSKRCPAIWPWAPEWWKPADPRRNLVKAAAIILAEIERLDRAAANHP